MDKIENHYHHCASCRHFGFREEGEKKQPYCTRLGYDTKPFYQFNCWSPTPRVKQAMAKKRREAAMKRRKGPIDYYE